MYDADIFRVQQRSIFGIYSRRVTGVLSASQILNLLLLLLLLHRGEQHGGEQHVSLCLCLLLTAVRTTEI